MPVPGVVGSSMTNDKDLSVIDRWEWILYVLYEGTKYIFVELMNACEMEGGVSEDLSASGTRDGRGSRRRRPQLEP